MERDQLRKNIFCEYDRLQFEKKAIEIFNYQYANNPVYKKFVDGCKIDPHSVASIKNIPFLPIELFKTNVVKTGTFEEDVVFTSSGTSGSQTSSHYVKELSLYIDSFVEAFKVFYCDPHEYVFLALLPSYLERSGSSLIVMMEKLISVSQDKRSGFFLNEHEKLSQLLVQLKKENKKVVLLGVTFALLDFAENNQISFPELIVMETGGMKGRRKEMIRAEVHEILKPAFGVETIHSEYGMTELLSQAYSNGNGIFHTPSWMKILVREMNDPFQLTSIGKSGAINVIDFANLDSCSFIATQDVGKIYEDSSFEVIGRFDNSDIRGCNLMVE